MLRDPISNLANTVKRSSQSKGIMKGLKNTSRLYSSMGQDQSKRVEGSGIPNIIKNITPKLLKIGRLTDREPVPNRSTVAAKRQGTNA